MEIRILTNDFKLLKILDGVPQLEYSECFQDAGEIRLTLPFSQKMLEMTAVGARIVVEELVFTIDSVRVSDDTIIITGAGIFDEFKHIYVTIPHASSATPNNYALELASALSLSGVSYSAYGLATTYDTIEVYDYCTSYASVLKRLFKEYGLGYRMRYNGDKNELEFHLLAEVDKAYDSQSRKIISDTRESYELVDYVYDVSGYKNYIQLLQWYPVTRRTITRAYDRSYGDTKRVLCEAVSIPAETEGELYMAFEARAISLFNEHRMRHYYVIRPTRELGIRVGDICRLEAQELSRGSGVLFSERRVRLLDTGRDELYVLEVDQ